MPMLIPSPRFDLQHSNCHPKRPPEMMASSFFFLFSMFALQLLFAGRLVFFFFFRYDDNDYNGIVLLLYSLLWLWMSRGCVCRGSRGSRNMNHLEADWRGADLVGSTLSDPEKLDFLAPTDFG
jgi:hypothetical protein